jgi:hypothetical protein
VEAEILPPQTADQTRTTLSREILLENHQQIDACALGCEISTLRRASLGRQIRTERTGCRSVLGELVLLEGVLQRKLQESSVGRVLLEELIDFVRR